MSKFKVGDKVRVLRKFEDEPNGIHWNQEMHDTIGKTGTVLEWYHMPTDRSRVSFGAKSDWTYLDNVLELADSGEDMPADSKITLSKVGDTVSLEVVGKLTRNQVASILDIVYGS